MPKDAAVPRNSFTGVPPWMLPFLYLMGGGAISAGGMKLSMVDAEVAVACPGEDELEAAIVRAEAAEAAHQAMMQSLQALAGMLARCQPDGSTEVW